LGGFFVLAALDPLGTEGNVDSAARAGCSGRVDGSAQASTGSLGQWARRVGVGLVLFCGFVLGLTLYFAAVPPIVERVVDARTGAPVEVTVCEGLDYAAGFDVHTERVETRSGRNGWFVLGPRIGSKSGVLHGVLSYWIVLDDPRGECWRDVGMAVNVDEVGRAGYNPYFPVVLERAEGQGAYHPWGAPWRKMGFPLFVTVPLIPHLQNVAECNAISDGRSSTVGNSIPTWRRWSKSSTRKKILSGCRELCACAVCLARRW